jgi:hypothetical protein
VFNFHGIEIRGCVLEKYSHRIIPGPTRQSLTIPFYASRKLKQRFKPGSNLEDVHQKAEVQLRVEVRDGMQQRLPFWGWITRHPCTVIVLKKYSSKKDFRSSCTNKFDVSLPIHHRNSTYHG